MRPGQAWRRWGRGRGAWRRWAQGLAEEGVGRARHGGGDGRGACGGWRLVAAAYCLLAAAGGWRLAAGVSVAAVGEATNTRNKSEWLL